MSDRLTAGDVGMIGRIVGRCHVGDSTRRVLRYLKSRMAVGAWDKCSRPLRRKVIRAALKCHADNRALYGRVMGGAL